MGPYSQAVEAGGALYVSGQLPIDGATGKMDEGVEAQTHRSLTNLRHILEEGGYTLGDVVKTTVLLQDIGDFAAMNAVYARFFYRADARPRVLSGGGASDGRAGRDRRRGGEVAGAFQGRGPHAETGAAGFRRPINASHVCGAHLLHLL